MAQIENVSDQLETYAFEVASIIEELMEKYDYSFDESAKVVELTIKDMTNDVFHHFSDKTIKVVLDS